MSKLNQYLEAVKKKFGEKVHPYEIIEKKWERYGSPRNIKIIVVEIRNEWDIQNAFYEVLPALNRALRPNKTQLVGGAYGYTPINAEKTTWQATDGSRIRNKKILDIMIDYAYGPEMTADYLSMMPEDAVQDLVHKISSGQGEYERKKMRGDF